MRRMSVALGDLAARAIEAFQKVLTTKAVTTHDGMIKAMSLKAARAMMMPARKPRGDAIMALGRGDKHSRWIPVFYFPPAPVRLNRSRLWPEAMTYADARAMAGA